jgi:dolichyldiphosphatase
MAPLSYHLTYHSARQVIWGLGIGALFGLAFYSVVELIPTHRPKSLLGRIRIALLCNSFATWCRLRDSWTVFPDGGIEAQWQAWNTKWEASLRAVQLGDKKVR